MVAVTYGVARVPASRTGRARQDRRAGQQLVRPLYGCAWSIARMEQARREIRMHTGLLPYSLDERGNRLVKSGSGDMPFGGWPR